MEVSNHIDCTGRPDFAYDIRIDFLRGRAGQFFVEYYYNNIPIDICGSKKPEVIYGARCDYEYFEKLIESLIIPDHTYETFCFGRPSITLERTLNFLMRNAMSLILLVGVLFFCCSFYRDYSNEENEEEEEGSDDSEYTFVTETESQIPEEDNSKVKKE